MQRFYGFAKGGAHAAWPNAKHGHDEQLLEKDLGIPRMSFMESCSRTQCSFEVSAPTREARTTRACSPPHAHGRPLHVALPECRESGLSRPPAPWGTGKTLFGHGPGIGCLSYALSIKPLGVVDCRACTQHFHFYHFVCDCHRQTFFFYAKFALLGGDMFTCHSALIDCYILLVHCYILHQPSYTTCTCSMTRVT